MFTESCHAFGECGYGPNNTFNKFFPYFKDKNKYGGILGIQLTAITVGFTIICFILYLFSEQIEKNLSNSAELLNFIEHIIILSFIQAILLGLENYSSALLKPVFAKIIQTIYLRLVTTFSITLYYLELISLDEIINVFILGYLIAIILPITYALKIHSRPFKSNYVEI